MQFRVSVVKTSSKTSRNPFKSIKNAFQNPSTEIEPSEMSKVKDFLVGKNKKDYFQSI